ncbi:MAG: type I glyceraldehyde-3-phosphate dehydrogenase [Coriobacteriales bacterium]
MAIKVGISGFGRIGRLVFRAMEKDPDFEVVAINGSRDLVTAAHLLKYDSVHGRVFDSVEVVGDGIEVDGRYVPFYNERNNLADIPWSEHGAEIVIESTGKYKTGEEAGAHIGGTVKKVIITAPGKDVDATIVMGVNEEIYDPEKHNVISNASCTTNCLAPVVKVLDKAFGIKRGYINTIHSYTNDQQMLDKSHKDLRRARAGAVSVIPTTTGAAKAVGVVLPHLKGKLDGMASRVPTPDGSMVDLVVELEKEVTKDEVNAAVKAASEGDMKGYIEYCTDPIVSVDVIGNLYSAVFDSQLTMVLGEPSNLIKVIAWYDNEAGYSERVKDLAKYVMQK